MTKAPENLTAEEARTWWRALMGNVAGLLRDADLLLSHQSPGRARSLLILAAEEFGKARWVYEAAEDHWSFDGGTVQLPKDFSQKVRAHAVKLDAAGGYGDGGSPFWADWFAGRRDTPALSGEERAAQAATFNRRKQAGFYVDRDRGSVSSPGDVPVGGVAELLARVAGAADMLFIEDHQRRIAFGGKGDAISDAHWRVIVGYAPADFEKPNNFLDPEGA